MPKKSRKKKSTVPPHVRMRNEFMRQMQQKVCQKIADEGKPIQDGFDAFKKHFFPDGAPETLLANMHAVWFLSADFTYDLIFSMMDDGNDVSTSDVERLNRIYAELAAFRKEATTFHTAPDTRQ